MHGSLPRNAGCTRPRGGAVMALRLALLALTHFTAADARANGWRNDGSDVWPGASPPAVFDEEAGVNILWVAGMPAESSASPVVADGRVFTLAEPDTLLCLDAGSGAILWARKVDVFSAMRRPERRAEFESHHSRFHEWYFARRGTPIRDEWKRHIAPRLNALGVPEPRWYEAGYTSSTPVTDGRRVWVRIGTGVAACFDLEGNLLWSALYPAGRGHDLELTYASPLLRDGKLVFTWAPETWQTDGTAWEYQGLIALDAETGKRLWKSRVFRAPGWGCGSPVIARASDTDLVVSAGGAVARLDNGRLLHRGIGICGEAASPVVIGDGDTVLFVEQPSHMQGKKLKNLPRREGDYVYPVRIELGRRNRLRLERAWERDDLTTGRHHPSPLVFDGLLYLLDRDLNLSVSDVSTGEPCYRARIPIGRQDRAKGGHWRYPSISAAGGMLVVNCDFGVFATLKPGRVFAKLGEGVLAKKTSAWVPSRPCFDGNRMYVRTDKALYCIGPRPAPAAASR
ncbi:MAG: hypothetical protein FJ224_04030 [Lentisphaerae bacterium]|nr:hypothetical protein [Lentisphaerota bacterium]